MDGEGRTDTTRGRRGWQWRGRRGRKAPKAAHAASEWGRAAARAEALAQMRKGPPEMFLPGFVLVAVAASPNDFLGPRGS